MKRVVDFGMVAHLWAHQSQDEARVQRGNFYFNGDTIYSYGSHFPIARHIKNKKGEKAILFTTRTYSPTTAGHISAVRQAIPPGVDVIYVHNPGYTWISKEDHSRNLEGIRTEIKSLMCLMSKARQRKPEYFGKIQTLAEQANKYIKFFRLRAKPVTIPNEEALLEQVAKWRAAAEKEERKKQRIRKQREKEYRERVAEDIEKWKAGENVPRFYVDEVFLRVKDDTVETSKGVEVPLDHALKLLPILRNGEHYIKNGHTIHIGHFAVDEIDTEGNLKAGCHFIKRAEIERIAAQLGV